MPSRRACRRSHVVDRDLEHRAARAGAVALAVHDSDAATARIAALRDEFREFVARRRLTQAVQIQFVLDRDKGRGAGGAAPGCARRARRNESASPPRWRFGASAAPSPSAGARRAIERHRLREIARPRRRRAALRACARPAWRDLRRSRCLAPAASHRGPPRETQARRAAVGICRRGARRTGGALFCHDVTTRSAIRVSSVTV